MNRLGKWLLYAILLVGLFLGGAYLSVRMPLNATPGDAEPSLSTDGSTQVPVDRQSGPPPGYEPPAPSDTPCLQREYVSRCIGRSTARTGLMELAGLQERRMRERGSYAADAATLDFQPQSGMVLRMSGGGDGWTAEYHSATAGVGCAVYAGEVEEPYRTVGGLLSESPGAVACDDPLSGGG